MTVEIIRLNVYIAFFCPIFIVCFVPNFSLLDACLNAILSSLERKSKTILPF